MSKTIVHLIANAHLDPVWLWNWQAGVDEALATFRSAVDRCHEYPEFRYTRGEAWLYQWVEKIDPVLFREASALIEAGRWSIAGGQWTQPDANLPTAAGWRKQFALGQRYFEDRFGIRPTVAYNVDTFGHPATLPDLLRESGYRGYVFHRPNESQVALPAQTFRWRGSAGSEVTGFRIAAAYVTRANELHGQLDLNIRAMAPGFGHTMMFYGLGNHGGGPTKATIEWLLEHRDQFEGVELRFSTVDDFFDATEQLTEKMPVVDFELQKTFPGCYSVVQDMKALQHRGERMLEQAEEMVRVFGSGGEGDEKAIERIDEAWKDLAFTEFHDILAGTSVPSSYISTRHMQGRAGIVAEEEIVLVSRSHARVELPPEDIQRIVLLNASEHDFEGHVEFEPFIDFDDWRERAFADEEGRAMPFQLITSEPNAGAMIHRTVFPISIPAKGRRVIQLCESLPQPPEPLKHTASYEGGVLSNGVIRAELSSKGISSLQANGKEMLGADGLSLHLREEHGDTWVFHQTSFDEKIAESLGGLDWTVEDQGPLRTRVFAEQRLGQSTVKIAVTLYAGEPEMHLDVQVVFAEKHKALQLPITLASSPTAWISGLAGGCVERQSGPDEMPFCGWDAIELEGAALCLHSPDMFSSRVSEDCWQFTLLRSPLMAWTGDSELAPAYSRRHSDQGWHEFHMILRAGDHIEPSKCEAHSAHQVKPPVIFDHYVGMNRPAWGNAPPRRLWTPDIPHARNLGHMKHLDEIAEEGKNWEENPD
ncbi:MAG: glycoside hydrolase family 38 C-terminal domain-containing protein [Akkermansiaceae bacterium]